MTRSAEVEMTPEEQVALIERWAALADRSVDKLPVDLAATVMGLVAVVAGDTALARRYLAEAAAAGADVESIGRSLEVLIASLGMPMWTRAGHVAGPELRSHADDQAAARIEAHYAADGDEAPSAIRLLAECLPEVAGLFIDTRGVAIGNDDAVDPVMRELLLSIFTAQGGFEQGALRHLRRSLDLGLSTRTLAAVLACLVITQGSSAWTRYGQVLWEGAVSYQVRTSGG
jgi:hypothetical protein